MGSWQQWRRRAALGVLVFLLSFGGLVFSGWAPPRLELVPATGVDGYRPSGKIVSGPELAMVFIGSPTCTWSTGEALQRDVGRAKSLLQRRADSARISFSATIIAQGFDPEAGMRYIRRFGSFDEVMLGRGWMNTGLLKYLYEQFPAIASTPQLLVVRRTIEYGDLKHIKDETLLVRRVGLHDIGTWVAAGAPVRLGHDTLVGSRNSPDSASSPQRL